MNKLLILCITSILFISACGGSNLTDLVVLTDIPNLRAFNIVDSFGVNTEFDGNIPLELSPFIDDGLFEIFWDVDNIFDGFAEDYQVNFLINDSPQVFRSLLITSNFCGPFERCDSFASQFCFYEDNLSMTCERPNSNDLDVTVDISELFVSIPQRLFFILEVCDVDGFACDTDFWPVLMN